MLGDLIHQHKEVKHLEEEKNVNERVPSPRLPFGTSSTAVSFAILFHNDFHLELNTFSKIDEEGLKVEGLEVGIAVVVGKVINIQHSETKSTYTIEDDTGSIDAVMWKDETTGKGLDEEKNTSEGQDLRVLGSVRTQSDKKYLMAFRLDQINGGQEEIDCHKLEIEHSKLIIRNMNEKENATIGANYGLSNSMVSSNSAPAANAGVGFGKKISYKVHKGLLN